MQARTGSAGCLALALILAGCRAASVVGTSGQSTPPDAAPPPSAPPMAEPPAGPVSPAAAPDPASAVPTPAAPDPAAPDPAAPMGTPVMATKARVPSLFSARRGEDVGMHNPFLGDVDGDGFDDFFIMAMLPQPTDFTFPLFGPEAHVYLYYGRANFPSRLSTDDADAVFLTTGGASGPLGDVNGDGYADFSIMHRGATTIIFGSPQRLRGMIAEGSIGTRWGAPPATQASAAHMVPMEVYAMGVGDYNGDGYDDIAVTATRELDPIAAVLNGDFGFTMSSYLVLGHGGDWPSIRWDPSLAVARFGEEHVPADPGTGQMAFDYPLMPMRAGDLDKDGRDDLLLPGMKTMFLFYGGRTLSGVVTAAQADASMAHEISLMPGPLGDADGDGAADLMMPTHEGTVQVVYGRRLSGVVTLQPDLTIDMNGIGGGPGNAAAGDIDGDGSPEIVVAAAMSGYDFEGGVMRPPTGALYVVRGTGTRAVGTYKLTEENLLMRGPLAGAQGPNMSAGGGLGTTLNVNGDVDGDGGLDILTSSPGAIVSAQSLGAVFLVPSTPRTPL
jgi:FG-GAP repeat/FG-GAP-like repeat